MSCCGQGRAALRAGAGSTGIASTGIASAAGPAPVRPVQAGAPAAVPPMAGTGSEVRLRWRNRASGTVSGPVTGRGYRVGGDAPVVSVDRRDAAGLLRSGQFTLA
jgi:hypothetical protein